MKRNFPDSSTRSTADFGWEAAKPEPTRLQKTLGTDRTELSMPPSLLKHPQTPEPTLSSAGRNNWRLEEKNSSANVWKTSDHPVFGSRTENRKIPKLDSSDCIMGAESKQQNLTGHPKPGVAERSPSFTAQRPTGLNTMQRDLHGPRTSYTFKPNSYQQKVDENKDKKRIQNVPANQLKLKERDSSLRIISAVIESMKHWSQYTHKAPLLFEVLGTLDSAVTPGQHSAKTFLLRDRKESVSCVFYEIDRELPRLIRGRVHRCVGNYDAKRKLFRCVSVRTATVSEQQTFQDFVQIADAEMSEYVKTSNEV
ncbi:spermatogenesis-associated protein 22 isoform X2 [Hemicordylus capensis]|uniref:spermatogenesis-associated protein 22 isoform X2 n=1 Tax=Hemicordylus capensis TaxID=884348 RepID=UPI002303E0D5|nr:spermatogenesis-associated protein 22 isoform X2 [Hemicordylus capensis]XP_053130717.1 spermatogenesis-associated protein 22 isoform X2 [Hemicordylus capensis]XP_053130718.1 spermatogenesis-associated protein 22 isoform X2 [Hemicordylus capensis]XP_053130719.1 spermatogenesis-associated protein 22 isoform X2 [Hemicordylus capensis]XP_053130720.1 spermatogenesis-associated protein 22 isoform X2 [Hemicordylus capensis]